MKNLSITLAFLILTFTSGSAFGLDCQLVKSYGKSERYDCRVEADNATKTFHVVKLRGDFKAGSYAHGYLLSQEIAGGLIKEVVARFEDSLKEGNPAQRKLQEAILSCYLNRVKSSVSQEFKDGLKSFSQGFRAGSQKAAQYSLKQLEESSYGIELSIAAEGLQHNIAKDPMGTYASLGAACGIDITMEGLETIITFPFKLGKALKMGCLGFVVPENENTENSLIHARNFDADLMESWNKAPALFLVEEPGYYRYIASTSAGMFYVGGVSGMNEKGISVSLHELSTGNYRTLQPRQSGVLAPFLQTRTLRETANLDEAITLIKKSKHFGAWTFLISDAKTNEVASIEVTGDRVQVARRKANASLGQTNHFLGSEMQNQFFTYNFNKKLESQSRLEVINNELQKDRGRINLEWSIDHLSGHIDRYEGFRSFGRTATKVYTVMSTIAMPAKNQFWVTLGDRLPASHSPFLGFEIDWKNLGFSLIDVKRTKQYDHIPNWEKSLQTYGLARMAYIRHLPEMSERLLSRAIDEAARDNIQEPAYYYIRARVRLERGMNREARQDLDIVWSKRESLHEYQAALAALYWTVAFDREKNASGNQINRRLLINYALNKFEKFQNQTGHFDLQKKIKLAKKLRDHQKIDELTSLDFVTVE